MRASIRVASPGNTAPLGLVYWSDTFRHEGAPFEVDEVSKVRGGSRRDANQLPTILPSDIQEFFQQQNLIAGLHIELPDHVFPTHTVSLSDRKGA